jgi:hypothetical protein
MWSSRLALFILESYKARGGDFRDDLSSINSIRSRLRTTDAITQSAVVVFRGERHFYYGLYSWRPLR